MVYRMLGGRCKRCGPVVVRVHGVNHILHLLITFLTCFLWAPMWVLLCFTSTFNFAQCTRCGGGAWRNVSVVRIVLTTLLLWIVGGFWAMWYFFIGPQLNEMQQVKPAPTVPAEVAPPTPPAQ